MTAKSKSQKIYRVIYLNQAQVYEVYCHHVFQSDMYGFVQLEDFIFGEKSKLLVDPGEEKLKSEFAGVKSSFIPVHSVIRIDEVSKEGTAKVHDSVPGSAPNVSAFPTPVKP